MSIKITKIDLKSKLKKYNIEKGDVILSINGYEVFDFFGIMQELNKKSMKFIVKKKNSQIIEFVVDSKDYHRISAEFDDMKMLKCSNKCIFCFVDQNPDNMRKALYVKDDDYRESLSYGNFITLSNLSPIMLKNIIEHRLSPLYVSIHSVENELRKKIFGRENSIENLNHLLNEKIKIHGQVVLVPDLNDGIHLRKTMEYAKQNKLLSLGIVPVGLTKHRANLYKIKAGGRNYFAKVIDFVEEWKIKNEFKRIYLADEFYIKAGYEIPDTKYYNGFPQTENGIGLSRIFLNQTKGNHKKTLIEGYAMLTGALFYKYLRKNRIFNNIRIYGVDNGFYGSGVTVTGLLTGKDIIECLKKVKECDIILSSIIFNGNNLTLDGLKRKDIEKESKKRLHILKSNFEIAEYLK